MFRYKMKNQIIILFSLPVFALISACQNNQEVKRESATTARVAEKTSVPQSDPSVPKPPEPPPSFEKVSGLRQTDGRQFDNQWLVILGALDKMEIRRKIGQLQKTSWQNGRSGDCHLVELLQGSDALLEYYRGEEFASKADAQGFTKKLKKAGINNYYKHAGKFVGKDLE